VSLAIVADAPLAACNTLRLPASARWYGEIAAQEDLAEALRFARANAARLMVLGGGSNVVLRERFDGLALRVRLTGRELLEETAARVVLRVAAGEQWHALVLACHARGWHGLENLALIPGTVGAAPIQNIGAYGVELAGFVREVHAVDRASGEPLALARERCAFRYRDSVFKGALAERLVITAVTFELPRGAAPCTAYTALAAELPDPGSATHADVLDAVIRLRSRRLPDPAVLPNAGSFFKNPVLGREAFAALQAREPGVVHWLQADGSVKLAAAWLVEQAGWKGQRRGDAGVHAQQALVLVNHGRASAAQILALAADIAGSVRARFGVALEIEPAVY
jgi:UDP-N-acetylmuramate dehydrogenase